MVCEVARACGSRVLRRCAETGSSHDGGCLCASGSAASCSASSARRLRALGFLAGPGLFLCRFLLGRFRFCSFLFSLSLRFGVGGSRLFRLSPIERNATGCHMELFVLGDAASSRKSCVTRPRSTSPSERSSPTVCPPTGTSRGSSLDCRRRITRQVIELGVRGFSK